MKDNERTLLLDSLRCTLDYSVDQATAPCPRPDSDDFYESLYSTLLTQDKEFQEKLQDSLGSFLVVTAPTGRGKTSAIMKTLRLLPKTTAFFLFDFKNEVEKLYDFPKETGGRHRYLRDLLKRELASKFLGDINSKIKFVFNALFDYFYSERMHQLILKWKVKLGNPHLSTSREDLWEVFSNDFEVAATEEAFVMERLTCAQMISCLKKTLSIKHFLLVLDNVDRVNTGIQPVLFSVAIDIFHGGKGDFGMIVAVREKNLLRFELSSQGGEVIEVVSLVTHATERTKPMKLSAPTAEFVAELLEKRYTFATKVLPQVASPTRFIFDQIKARVKARFVEEKLYNLANHNLRSMLNLNREFIEYLMKLSESHLITDARNAVTIDDQDFASYLYRWMYSVANQRHEMLIDISDRYDALLKGTIGAPIECDLELIVLAWLTNSHNRSLRVNDVVKDFDVIGVDRTLVVAALHRLYDVPLDFRYVEIGDSEANTTWEEIDKRNPRVLITPLGREFVESTITKFEFLYHCLTYPNVVDINAPEMLAPVSKDHNKKIKVVLGFLEKMKKVHSAAINQLKTYCSKQGLDWEPLYRERFCMKQQLILERIVFSHHAHIKDSEQRNLYRELLESYLSDIGSTRKPSW